MKYFAQCHSLEALKAEYKRLAKMHHPDIGGDAETMKAINAEYDYAVDHIAADPGHRDARQASAEDSEAFRAVIAALVKVPGIVIELCGTWIWVTGDTYANRDALKAAGCRWAKRKAAWYWHTPEDGCRKSRRELSLDDIRHRHGSQLIAQTAASGGLRSITA